MVEKYAGETQLLFNWMPRSAPSIVKPLEYEQLVMRLHVVTDVETTPGTVSIAVTRRSTMTGICSREYRWCPDRSPR